VREIKQNLCELARKQRWWGTEVAPQWMVTTLFLPPVSKSLLVLTPCKEDSSVAQEEP
jgi:hypothetical protein